MNHQVALSNKKGKTFKQLCLSTAELEAVVWSLQGESHALSKRKKCSKSISKTRADSDGRKKVMNILQAGSAELHSRWHSRLYSLSETHRPSSTARAKPCVWLFISSLPVGPLPYLHAACTPPASGHSQGHYAVNWTYKWPFWNGVLLLEFRSEWLRLETGHMWKLYVCNTVLVPCRRLIWISTKLTVKLWNILTLYVPFKSLWSWINNLFFFFLLM